MLNLGYLNVSINSQVLYSLIVPIILLFLHFLGFCPSGYRLLVACTCNYRFALDSLKNKDCSWPPSLFFGFGGSTDQGFSDPVFMASFELSRLLPSLLREED